MRLGCAPQAVTDDHAQQVTEKKGEKLRLSVSI